MVCGVSIAMPPQCVPYRRRQDERARDPARTKSHAAPALSLDLYHQVSVTQAVCTQVPAHLKHKTVKKRRSNRQLPTPPRPGRPPASARRPAAAPRRARRRRVVNRRARRTRRGRLQKQHCHLRRQPAAGRMPAPTATGRSTPYQTFGALCDRIKEIIDDLPRRPFDTPMLHRNDTTVALKMLCYQPPGC